jgi:hypothetical protein
VSGFRIALPYRATLRAAPDPNGWKDYGIPEDKNGVVWCMIAETGKPKWIRMNDDARILLLFSIHLQRNCPREREIRRKPAVT